jgi:hypothetical protein
MIPTIGPIYEGMKRRYSLEEKVTVFAEYVKRRYAAEKTPLGSNERRDFLSYVWNLEQRSNFSATELDRWYFGIDPKKYLENN